MKRIAILSLGEDSIRRKYVVLVQLPGFLPAIPLLQPVCSVS